MNFKRMHPFLIVSYLYKSLLRLITPFFLFLIFQSSMDFSYSILNQPLFLTAIILTFLIYGLFNWLTIKVKIDKQGRLVVKRYFFAQETIEIVNVHKVMNISRVNWFPGNIMNFTDFYIQLEGDEESTIKLPCLRNKDYLSLGQNLKKTDVIEDELKVYPVPIKEAIFGFIGRGLLLSFILILFSNFLSSLSNDSSIELKEYFSYYFWLQNLAELPYIIYIYISVLLFIYIIKNVFQALSFELSISQKTDEVFITSGFFYKKQLKVYAQNIKGFHLEQNITQRLLKRTTFFIETISEDKRKIILHPFLKVEDIEKLYKFIFKDELDYQNIALKSNGRKQWIAAFFILFIITYAFIAIMNFDFIVRSSFIIPFSAALFLFVLFLFINYLTQKYYYFPKKNILLVKKGVINRKTFFLRDDNLNMLKKVKLPWHFQNEFDYHLNYFNNFFKKRTIIRNVDWSKNSKEEGL